MRIGACGIACEVCGLYVNGICEGCDAGTAESTPELVEKLRQLGVLCPALECAMKRKIAYCSKDCKDFPCEIYKTALFPFSKEFLEMFESRKNSDEK